MTKKNFSEIGNRSVEIIQLGKEREKEDLKQMNRDLGTCGRIKGKTYCQQKDKYKLFSAEKYISRDNDWKISKFGISHKPTDSIS